MGVIAEVQGTLQCQSLTLFHSLCVAIFSATPGDSGSLLLEYLTPTTYASSHPLAFLSEFQIHRRVHGIIGVLDSSEFAAKPLAEAVASFHSSLKDLPKTFATKIYGFDPSDKQVAEGRSFKDGDGLVMIPNTGDVNFFLNTVLADFASELLYEFSNMVSPRLSIYYNTADRELYPRRPPNSSRAQSFPRLKKHQDSPVHFHSPLRSLLQNHKYLHTPRHRHLCHKNPNSPSTSPTWALLRHRNLVQHLGCGAVAQPAIKTASCTVARSPVTCRFTRKRRRVLRRAR